MTVARRIAPTLRCTPLHVVSWAITLGVGLGSPSADAQPGPDRPRLRDVAPNAEDVIPVQRPSELAPIRDVDLTSLQQRVAPCVVRARATTDLGPGFRPRMLEGDGVATWIELPSGPALITSFTWLTQVVRVEIEEPDGRWVEVTPRYGTAIYDLVALEAAPRAGCDPLPIADRLPIEAALFSCADTACTTMAVNAFGVPLPEQWAYYVRTALPMRNGPVVVDRQGRLVALVSVFAPVGTGSLAIPARWIPAWHEEWPQLTGTGPTGWSPRVRTEPFEVRTGGEALR